MNRFRQYALLPVLVATVALLAGCGSGTDPDAAGTTTPQPAVPSAAAPTHKVTASATPEALTCKTLIEPEVVKSLTGKGWTAKEEPLTVGDVTLKEGLSCTWADYSSPTGNLVTYAWAPISEADATKAQRSLESKGWIREKTGGNVYVTEDPATAMTTDADGYGLTYQFGDGWVTFSDTRQGLLLILRPGS